VNFEFIRLEQVIIVVVVVVTVDKTLTTAPDHDINRNDSIG